MPFVVSVSVNHAGVFYDVGSRVSDELGASILEEHPSSLVRIAHDDDICLADCDRIRLGKWRSKIAC